MVFGVHSCQFGGEVVVCRVLKTSCNLLPPISKPKPLMSPIPEFIVKEFQFNIARKI